MTRAITVPEARKLGLLPGGKRAKAAPRSKAAVSSANRKAALAGRDTESVWTRSHEAMWRERIAYIHKVDTPRVLTGGRLRFTRKTGTDFRGVMLDGTRREVAAESKSTSAASLNLAQGRCALKPHQRAALDSVHRAGGVAFILLAFGTPTGRRTFALPWAASLDGRRVCKLSDPAFTRYEIDCGGVYLTGASQ